jgi:pyrroloquinoline quinone biosynthesis protein B
LSGIFLTHAHIGHYTGLMHLGREAMGTRDMPVYAMPRMSAFLRDNGPWSQLVSLGNIELRGLQHMAPVNLSAVTVTPFLVPHRDEYSETVGYSIQGPNRSAIFIPDINKWEDWDESIVEMVESVDYALIDASFFADGELGNRDMSQIPHPFVAETMALFEDSSLTVRDRIWFIHMNQSNPLLNSNTEQTRMVLENGFNVAREGVRLPL